VLWCPSIRTGTAMHACLVNTLPSLKSIHVLYYSTCHWDRAHNIAHHQQKGRVSEAHQYQGHLLAACCSSRTTQAFPFMPSQCHDLRAAVHPTTSQGNDARTTNTILTRLHRVVALPPSPLNASLLPPHCTPPAWNSMAATLGRKLSSDLALCPSHLQPAPWALLSPGPHPSALCQRQHQRQRQLVGVAGGAATRPACR